MATIYMDPVGGNDANTGLSFAQRIKSGQRADAVATNGDDLRIIQTPEQTISGCGFTLGSMTVTIPSGNVKVIDDCQTAWTGATNVTSATSNNAAFARTGVSAAAYATPSTINCIQLTVAAAFTTGLIAYKALGSTVDFSAFTGVSFNFGSNAYAAIGTGLKLAFCSDTTGTTIVTSVPLTFNTGTTTDGSNAYNFDTGSALPSGIQSIAIYADTDPGTTILYFDSIVATTASGINCTSIVKESTHPYYICIAGFPTDTSMQLFVGYSMAYNSYPAWTTGTRDLTFCNPFHPGQTTTAAQTSSFSATSCVLPLANKKFANITGGWDTTAMTTMSGWTALLNRNSVGSFTQYPGKGAVFMNANYTMNDTLNLDRLISVNCSMIASSGSCKVTFGDLQVIGTLSMFISISGTAFFANSSGNSLVMSGYYTPTATTPQSPTSKTSIGTVSIAYSTSNYGHAAMLIKCTNGGNLMVDNLNIAKAPTNSVASTQYGVFGTAYATPVSFNELSQVYKNANIYQDNMPAGLWGTFVGGTLQTATASAVCLPANTTTVVSKCKFTNVTFTGYSLPTHRTTSNNNANAGDTTCVYENCSVLPGQTIIMTNQMWSETTSSVYRTAAPSLMARAFTSDTLFTWDSSNYVLAEVPVLAGQTITFNAWMKAGTAGQTSKLVLFALGKLAGNPSTLTSAIQDTSTTNWTLHTISWTATENGIARIQLGGLGSTTNSVSYIDDLTVTVV